MPARSPTQAQPAIPPPYRRVAEKLCEQIESGAWREGELLPSLRQLAPEFGVSLQTMRMAVDLLKLGGMVAPSPNRRRMHVARGWRHRALHRGVVLELFAGDLALGMSREGWVKDIQCGLLAGAGEIKASLFVAHGYAMRQCLPLEHLDRPLVGVAIVLPVFPEVLARCEKLNVPVVMVDCPDHNSRVHTIAADNVAAAYDATRRLVELGHRRIASVRFYSMAHRDIEPDSRERVKGFSQALREAGLAFSRKSVFTIASLDAQAKSKIRTLLRARPRFTAVLAFDETVAGLVEEVTREERIRVPQDLSIACVQRKGEAASCYSGPCVDFAEMGRQAVRMLQGPRTPARHERIEAEWKEGRTLMALT